MFSGGISIVIPGSNPNLLGYVDHAIGLAQPTVGDCLYVGQLQRSRILHRTAQGVDFDNVAFHAYSTNGPFYYYPNKGGSERGRMASAKNLANKLGVSKVTYKTKKTEASASRTRLGIKFASYAAFKSFLGRIGVDLLGPKAPHMLQGLIVKVGGIVLGNDEGWQDITVDTGNVSGIANNTPATEIVIGIYGEEAERAEGHNQGSGHLPRRKFLAANEQDKILALQALVSRASFRMRRALKGEL